MILQNISKAIREQNYYAVALEFVIVIAGVVIGFQIQAWNQDRANRETERVYLARLYEDMTRSVCRLADERNQLIDWNSRARATLNALLDNTPDAVTGNGFELVASTRIQTGTPQRATLNELVGGGQMNLISSPHLRAQIAATEADLTSLSGYIQILVGAQRPFMENIHTRLRPAREPDWAVTYDFSALVIDDEFINSLGQALRLARANSSWLEGMIETSDSLRLAIGRELGVDPPQTVDCEASGGDAS
ncbi:MAG: hypothetical protein RIA71_16145 [Oceanicaulis sp.]